jgi:hypothetical protein
MSRELVYAIQGFVNAQKGNLVSAYLVPIDGHKLSEIKLGASYDELAHLKNSFEKQSHVSSWGAFDVIFRSFQGIKAYAYGTADPKDKNIYTDERFMASAVQTLVDEESGFDFKKPNHSAKPFFFREYSKAVLTRLHASLLDELDKYEQKNGAGSIEKTHSRLDTSSIVKQYTNNHSGPLVHIKNGTGYFQFVKKGPSIKIGKARNQPYRILELLVANIEAWKLVDDVYEKIWGNKYKLDNINSRHFKTNKIKEVFKEIQSIKEYY